MYFVKDSIDSLTLVTIHLDYRRYSLNASYLLEDTTAKHTDSYLTF